MKYINSVGITILLVLITSCDSMLVESPKSQIASDDFYKTEKDAVAAVNAMYGPLRNQFHDFQMIIATTDDGWSAPGAGAALVQEMWRYNYTPNNTRIFLEAWQIHYDVINRANNAVTKIPDIEMNESLRNRLVGEALFIRAFAYFKLVQFYGGVPLITTPTQSMDGIFVERASVDDVYSQIVEDLSLAESYLWDSSSTATGRPSITAAKALLAKVFLTTERWDLAASKNAEVINSGEHTLVSNFATLFHRDTDENDENIFVYNYEERPGGGYPAHTYLPRNEIEWRGLGAFSATRDLYDSFDPNDLRRDVTMFDQWVNPQGDSITVSFAPWFRKFFDMEGDHQSSAIDMPVLRYADVLLMYAEALNESNTGPTPEAFEALNKVRRRAYGENINSPSAVDYPPGLGYEAFKQAVWDERRWELAGEYHRLFDLRRTGRLEAVITNWLQNGVETAGGSAVGTFQSKHHLYPIPQRELDVNPNLTQNPGWD